MWFSFSITAVVRVGGPGRINVLLGRSHREVPERKKKKGRWAFFCVTLVVTPLLQKCVLVCVYFRTTHACFMRSGFLVSIFLLRVMELGEYGVNCGSKVLLECYRFGRSCVGFLLHSGSELVIVFVLESVLGSVSCEHGFAYNQVSRVSSHWGLTHTHFNSFMCMFQ